MENSQRRAAVLGHPISHSLSPALHGYWLKQNKIEGIYEAIDTPPQELKKTLNALAEKKYTGVNLTIPLKETAIPLIDVMDPIAARIGAVNTVIFRGEKKYGYNTDAYGFATSLGSGEVKNAVILGAGGAARAIAIGLMERGCSRITLCNRSQERAQALRQNPGSQRVNICSWNQRHAALEEADLLVNATSLGMRNQPPLDLNLEMLPVKSTVADIVYNPLETGLLASAKARGNRTVDGLGMLIFQGQKAFELFFGKLPQVTEELRAMMQDIK